MSLNAMVKHCLTLPSPPLPPQRGEEAKGAGVLGAVWLIEGVMQATQGLTTPNLHTYQVRQRGIDACPTLCQGSVGYPIGAVVVPSSQGIDLCIEG